MFFDRFDIQASYFEKLNSNLQRQILDHYKQEALKEDASSILERTLSGKDIDPSTFYSSIADYPDLFEKHKQFNSACMRTANLLFTSKLKEGT